LFSEATSYCSHYVFSFFVDLVCRWYSRLPDYTIPQKLFKVQRLLVINKDNKYVGKINKKDSIFNGKVVYNGYHPSCVRQRKTGEYNNPEKIAELIKTVF
ncbi:MAG: hypothetical protein IKA85_01560, partial [Clostridia bacterium]|nr:hypothetical protein [Clostridia bacterium]